jgi:hypothetical protein
MANQYEWRKHQRNGINNVMALMANMAAATLAASAKMAWRTKTNNVGGGGVSVVSIIRQ